MAISMELNYVQIEFALTRCDFRSQLDGVKLEETEPYTEGASCANYTPHQSCQEPSRGFGRNVQ